MAKARQAKKAMPATKARVAASVKVQARVQAHGGRAHVGVRKTARPLDLKKPIVVTLKSKWAKGKLSLAAPSNKKSIDTIIRERADQFGITIKEIENDGSSLKIILKARAREAFQDYLRTMSALIARQVTGARRGKPFGKRFWDHLAQTESLTEN